MSPRQLNRGPLALNCLKIGLIHILAPLVRQLYYHHTMTSSAEETSMCVKHLPLWLTLQTTVDSIYSRGCSLELTFQSCIDALLHIISMHMLYRHEFDLYICI